MTLKCDSSKRQGMRGPACHISSAASGVLTRTIIRAVKGKPRSSDPNCWHQSSLAFQPVLYVLNRRHLIPYCADSLEIHTFSAPAGGKQHSRCARTEAWLLMRIDTRIFRQQTRAPV